VNKKRKKNTERTVIFELSREESEMVATLKMLAFLLLCFLIYIGGLPSNFPSHSANLHDRSMS
jgi:hypothetical protein